MGTICRLIFHHILSLAPDTKSRKASAGSSISGSGSPYEGQLPIGPNHLKTAVVVNNDERALASNRAACDSLRLHLLGESDVKLSHRAVRIAAPLIERERRL